MFTTLMKLPPRSASPVLTLALFSMWVAGVLSGQAQSVVSSTLVAVPHNEVYGAPWQNQVSNRGDFVLLDFKATGLYEFPGNNGAEVTIAAPGAIAGGFSDSGIAIDPRNNNLYVDNNYNGGLLLYPYDAKTGLGICRQSRWRAGSQGTLAGRAGTTFRALVSRSMTTALWPLLPRTAAEWKSSLCPLMPPATSAPPLRWWRT